MVRVRNGSAGGWEKLTTWLAARRWPTTPLPKATWGARLQPKAHPFLGSFRRIITAGVIAVATQLVPQVGADARAAMITGPDASLAVSTRIFAGETGCALVDGDGILQMWGYSHSGVLGDGRFEVFKLPGPVGPDAYSTLSFGYHALAVQSNGTLWAWGNNSAGQVGDGSTTNRSTPVMIGSGYAMVATGASHSLAIKSDGSLWAWGSNQWGQLGNGGRSGALVPQLIGAGYAAVTAGARHSVALKSDGTLWAWGANDLGQVNADTNEAIVSPVQIGTGYKAISASFNDYTLALKTDGSLWAWGDNTLGKLGDGTTTKRAVPTLIGNGYADVTTGGNFAIARKSDGTLWAWGRNDYGQFGDGTTASSLVPKQIANDYVSIAAGRFVVIALKADGSIWGWGWNAYKQLGDGTSASRLVPQQIIAGTAITTSTAAPTTTTTTTTTTGAPTTTTVATATTTTNRPMLRLAAGWNLVGNGVNRTIDVASAFGDATRIVSVWKWNDASAKWAFYSPRLSGPTLAGYAAGKGYDVLTGIQPKDGYWVNALAATQVAGADGSSILLAESDLQPGWSLKASADGKTPSQLNQSLNGSLTSAGKSIITVWAWDSAGSTWRFFSPLLEAQGGTVLTSYIANKGYKPFVAALSAVDGFWVNTNVAANGSGIPAAPSTISVSGGDSQVTLTWPEVAGATAYNVYYSDTPGVTKTNGTKIANAKSGTPIALVNGKAYYFGVSAVTAAGESALSGELSCLAGGLTVAGLVPSTGIPGATIQILGTGFIPQDLVNNRVSFNGRSSSERVTATVTAATATMLTVVVPASAKTGTVSVTTSGTATSAAEFSVLTAPVGNGNLTVAGSAFSSLSALTAKPELDASSGFMEGTSSEGTTFNRSWTGDTGSSGAYQALSVQYTLTASEDLLAVSATDPNGKTFWAGPGKVTAPTVCHVSGTNAIAYPDCTAWNISVNKTTGSISFASTPIFDLNDMSKTGTVTGAFSFTPITVANGVKVRTPVISSVTPSMAPVGTTVTIAGANFDSVPPNNVITFNGTQAMSMTIVGTTTQLSVSVPAGATTGYLTVVTKGGTARKNFTVGSSGGSAAPTQTGTFVASCQLPEKYGGDTYCQDYYLPGTDCGGAGSIMIKSANTCAYTNSGKVLIGTCTSPGAFTSYSYLKTTGTLDAAQQLSVAQQACASQPNGIWTKN